MGSPVSAIIAEFCMEFLEQKAIATAPIDCRPKLWKRYVDDVLEIIKDGKVKQLTHHLNQTEPTGNIKFTHEPEKDNRIPFLDTLITRKPDGSVKLLIYRKPTHTDQYLNFTSHHPLQHKLDVVRTLMDRAERVVTDPEDRKKEEDHIRQALHKCNYPSWTFDKVKNQQANKGSKSKKSANNNNQSKGMVVLPYVQGTSEKLQRVYRKHNIATAFKPHFTLRKSLVHPKDKRDTTETTGCVYEISCKNCDFTYVGETGRSLATRLKEHRTEVEKITKKIHTRATRLSSISDQHKSAIADHVASTNHIIDWEDPKILHREGDKFTRWIRESIWIRRRGNKAMNNEGGAAYNLNHVYDHIIQKSRNTSSGCTNHHT